MSETYTENFKHNIQTMRYSDKFAIIDKWEFNKTVLNANIKYHSNGGAGIKFAFI